MIIAVDLDGVLCEEGTGWAPEDWLARRPKWENIRKINKLYDQGHRIVIFTARRPEDRAATEAWLRLHHVKYDFLVMGKPRVDLYVDERAKLKAIEDLFAEEEEEVENGED